MLHMAPAISSIKPLLCLKRVHFLTKYQIRGGSALHGTIQISGAKNAAVAIIPAALLVDGVCRIENIPQISDEIGRAHV